MHLHLSHMHCNADNDKYSLILKAPYQELIIILLILLQQVLQDARSSFLHWRLIL